MKPNIVVDKKGEPIIMDFGAAGRGRPLDADRQYPSTQQEAITRVFARS
jgi:hypothetical protein